MFIPRNRISHIANFVNHGTQDPKVSGFVRDGETFDHDPNKPTYFHNGYPHNGTDICIQENYPLIAWKEGLVCEGAYHTDGGGLNLKIYDAFEDRLYVFTHLNKVFCEENEELELGKVFAFSGCTGTLCGEPHIHFSVYSGDTMSSNYLIDPLGLPEFQDLVRYIPYPPRKGDHAECWLDFNQRYKLYINGSFEHMNKRGEECFLKFYSNKKIEAIYHTGKVVFDGKDQIKEYYGTKYEITGVFTERHGIFETAFVQEALPGIYYYQAKTPSGLTVPARIIVI